MSDTYNPVIKREEIAKRIGINLKKLCLAMGWTQSKMSEITGFSEAALSNYFKGKRLPDIDFLLGLSAMESVKRKGINLTLDDFLSGNFDPERAQVANNQPEEPINISDHQDFLGTYICYFYDQSKAVHNLNTKSNRELRFGLLSVLDDYNCVTAEQKMKVFASFYKEQDLEKVIRLKKEADSIFKENKVVANRNEMLSKFYSELTEGFYSGEVTFSAQHTFINIFSNAHRDNALMILYSPPKRSDNAYLGGIGSIASIAHGRMHMPTAQKIIVSKYELGCSFEEISDHLSMSSAPVSQTEEANALLEICKKLYDKEAPMGFLNDEDKMAIIENRLNQLVRNYIEKNVCCVGSVSEEEDKKVYSLIKKYAD